MKPEHIAGICPACMGDVAVYAKGKALMIQAHTRDGYDRRGSKNGKRVKCLGDRAEGLAAMDGMSTRLEQAANHAEAVAKQARFDAGRYLEHHEAMRVRVGLPVLGRGPQGP